MGRLTNQIAKCLVAHNMRERPEGVFGAFGFFGASSRGSWLGGDEEPLGLLGERGRRRRKEDASHETRLVADIVVKIVLGQLKHILEYLLGLRRVGEEQLHAQVQCLQLDELGLCAA